MNSKYKHAKERFLKRYGREIETEQINALEHLIRNNKVVSMSTTMNPDRLQVTVKVGKDMFHCIYCKGTGDIITFIDINERKHRRKRKKMIKNGNRRGSKKGG